MNTSHLDLLDAKMRLQEYEHNTPKHWFIEAVDQKNYPVDCRVDAHTLDIAKSVFLRQFPMHTITKCTRIKSFIEKKGG
tara:strand:- start:472 stop:708 length:237 start_codon:yes stop_codon:yes gene_type:complete